MPKTVEELNRDAFINAIYNDDEIEIPDDLAVELIHLYDIRQAHAAENIKARNEYYKRLEVVSLGFGRA